MIIQVKSYYNNYNILICATWNITDCRPSQRNNTLIATHNVGHKRVKAHAKVYNLVTFNHLIPGAS